VQTIEEENLLESSKMMSDRFRHRFEKLKEELPIIQDVRVCGMMIGIELNIEAVPAVKKCLDRGLLINATHDTVVRLLPALNITEEDVDAGCDILCDVLREMAE